MYFSLDVGSPGLSSGPHQWPRLFTFSYLQDVALVLMAPGWRWELQPAHHHIHPQGNFPEDSWSTFAYMSLHGTQPQAYTEVQGKLGMQSIGF